MSRPYKVCVDLDRTLLRYDKNMAPSNAFGEPFPGAVAAMKAMRDKGYEVYIYTCRTNPRVCPDLVAFLEALRIHLDKWDIPYTAIYVEAGKPIADAYIDDKAVNCCPEFDDLRPGREGEAWKNALEMLEWVLDDERERRRKGGAA